MSQSEPRSPPDRLDRPDHPTLDLLRQRWERLNRQNEHWMACIVGQEGMGKSYTALKLARMVDPSFDESRVIFDPHRFIEILKDERYSAGETYVIDEAGVSLGNRTWQDKDQVELNQALQLIRSHNLGLVFTLPRLGELDTQTEGRLQDVIELREKNTEEQWVSGSWWELDVDRLNMSSGKDGVFKQKPYWKGSRVDRIRFTPPEGEFVTKYEERKEEFQTSTYAELLGEEEGDEDDDDDAQVILETARKARRDGVGDLVRMHGGHNKPVLKKDLIRTKYDLTHANAQQVKEVLREDPNIDIEAAYEQRTQRERDE